MITYANRIADVEEYYFGKKLAEVRSLNTSDFSVINLGIGSPDMPPSAETILALSTSALAASHHGYQSYTGILALRQAIAAYSLRTYDISLDPESMILPLMGSKEGILHISMAFVNEGDEVLIPNPGYPTYSSAARLAGGTIRTYPMDESRGWAIDIETLSRQDLSRVKLMWINFPHMPTGRVASSGELEKLVGLARTHKFLLVNDNPYSMILNNNPLSLLSIPGAEGVSMELNSLSKSHNMAGWRIGWVAGRKEYVEAVLRVKSNMDSGMFLSMQHGAIEALKNGATWFDELNVEYRKRRKAAHEILSELDCRYDAEQAGLFVWAKVPHHVADVADWIDEILYATKVFVTPGFIFGSAGDRYIRVSLCAPVATMEEARSRIATWKDKFGVVSSGEKKIEAE